jgi:hypothetical protein
MSNLDRSKWESLTRRLRGEAIWPGDPTFEEARKGYNARGGGHSLQFHQGRSSACAREAADGPARRGESALCAYCLFSFTFAWAFSSVLMTADGTS